LIYLIRFYGGELFHPYIITIPLLPLSSALYASLRFFLHNLVSTTKTSPSPADTPLLVKEKGRD